MKTQPTTQKICVISLKLLGDFWTLRIIDALSGGEVRYCELQRRIGNVNPVTLTSRLKKLEDARLINRTEEPINKVAVSYSLTELGHAALPVLSAVNHFSDKLALA
jgi:DNA-binding HxlR family transcriptional regulator